MDAELQDLRQLWQWEAAGLPPLIQLGLIQNYKTRTPQNIFKNTIYVFVPKFIKYSNVYHFTINVGRRKKWRFGRVSDRQTGRQADNRI